MRFVELQPRARVSRRLSTAFGGGGGREVTEPYFPEEAVACLRRTRHNPTARPSLELVSGSFIWEDEFADYVEFVAHCRAQGCLRYWEPVGYRTSVIRGRPNEGFRCGWEELRRVCPGCGRVVKLHDALCMRCGTELEYPDVAVASEAAARRPGA